MVKFVINQFDSPGTARSGIVSQVPRIDPGLALISGNMARVIVEGCDGYAILGFLFHSLIDLSLNLIGPTTAH